MALEFEFILALAVIFVTNYLLIPVKKYGIPVLGAEILAGMIFGSIFGLVSPGIAGFEVLPILAALGLLLIMFDAGLELEPSIIKNHAKTVTELGIATFLIPFLAGLAFGFYMGLSAFASILVGITVSTTSLGLIHPLLEEFNLAETENGQIILSVTVLNDILSVVALAYGLAFLSGNIWLSIVTVTAALVIFLYIAPFKLGERLSHHFSDTLEKHTVRFSVLVMMVLALVMEQVGIHAVLGAFFAGLLISEISKRDHDVQKELMPATNLVAPVFFFFVGMQLPFQEFPFEYLSLIVGVLVLGIGAKIVGAWMGSLWAGVTRKTEYLLIASMPGRLSISVAAAEIGLRQGLITEPLYYAFIILSVTSVFFSVLSFKFVASRY